MSQADIIKFLENNKSNWFSAKDLSNKMDVGVNTLRTNLLRLYRYNEILRKETRIHNYQNVISYLWRYKE